MSTAGKRRLARHYAEMVAVMFLGMIVLALPAGWLFRMFGTSWAKLSPGAMLFAMAVTMTVPMVAWMRYRGHAWRPNIEMAAAMLLPAFAAIGLHTTGLVAGTGALMVIEHAAMLVCMLGAMLLRHDEYASATHAHGERRRGRGLRAA